MSEPAIITCALSGVAANRDQCPGIPYTPEEYAKESRRAFDAGCTIVHVHARKPDGTPTQDIEDYKAIRDAIVTEVPEMIINFSTGAIGASREERIHHIPALKPHIAALNMGTMNYAKYSPKRKDFVFSFVFMNPLEDIRFYLKHMRDAGVRPELECFDVGQVAMARPLLDIGEIQAPVGFSFIMGVVGGIPATRDNLACMKANLPGDDTYWQVIGIGREQWQMTRAALDLGGHVRVGFEDNFYLPDGQMAESNGDLVAEAASAVAQAGRTVASAETTRGILRLPASNTVL